MLENDTYLYFPTILKDRAIQICMKYTDVINPLMWSRISLEIYIYIYISFGGIGIRSAVQLAPSAFMASAAGCTPLAKQIPYHHA